MSWLRKVLGGGQAASGGTPVPLQGLEWKARGNAALAAGHMAEAARCYEQGLVVDPSDAALRLNLGFALLELGRAAPAVSKLEQALALRRATDTFAHEAQYLLGRAERMLGKPDAALARLEEALASRPDFVPAITEARALLQQAGRHEEALGWARRWCQLDPTTEAWLAVAEASYLAGRHTEALEALGVVLTQRPGHAAALQGQAFILLAQGRAQEALAAFDAALANGATGADPLFGRAQALRAAGRLEEALEATRRVLAADAGHRAALAEHIGLLIDLFRLDEAQEALERALGLYPDDPDLRWARATARLQAGNLEGGWADHEVRYVAPAAGLKSAPPDYGVPTWTGAEDLQGRRILVLSELGLGDNLQFVRYVPLLQARGAKVTLHTVPTLLGLFQDSLPGVRVVDSGQMEKPDYQVLLLSLPLAFRTTLATLPAQMPYLRSRPDLRSAWEERLGPRRGLRVGLAWSGTTLFRNDARRWRSIPLDLVRKALDLPGVQFVSLQKEVRQEDRSTLESWDALSHHGDELRTFADTAALVDLMDVVISVDTSMAHLAGGLDRPARILLPHNPDWRWFLHREDSPWYPSARLYRQPTPGDWATGLARVRAELESLAAAG